MSGKVRLVLRGVSPLVVPCGAVNRRELEPFSTPPRVDSRRRGAGSSACARPVHLTQWTL